MTSKLSKNDEWWAGLTIGQKERIARKAAQETGMSVGTTYPACSRWWMTLSEERKTTICDHCTDRHGYLLADDKKGKPQSF